MLLSRWIKLALYKFISYITVPSVCIVDHHQKKKTNMLWLGWRAIRWFRHPAIPSLQTIPRERKSPYEVMMGHALNNNLVASQTEFRCQGRELNSPPGRILSTFLLRLNLLANSAAMSTVTVHCRWEDEMARERIVWKTKCLILHEYGSLSAVW